MPLHLPGVPFKLTAEDMGGFDLGAALQQGFQNFQKFQEAKNTPRKLEAEYLQSQLQNKLKQKDLDWVDRLKQAGLEHTQAGTGNLNASTGLTQENTLKQRILNKFLPEREQAQLGEIGARSDYYKMGGGRGGVGSKDEALYHYSVSQLNPGFNEEQSREAADAYADGRDTLADGTPLAPMTPTVRRSLDRAIKSTTTSPLLTSGVQANQAEKEIDVLEKFADKGLAPYADTYFGMSPEQIVDSTKTDKPSQQKLGKFIASQALQYEIAQNRIKLAGGRPGVKSTEELMKLSGQLIKTHYPQLSGTARKEASDYLTEALKQGNKARQSVGLGASSLHDKVSDGFNYKTKPGGAVGEMTLMYKEGKPHFIPVNEVEEAIKEGYRNE